MNNSTRELLLTIQTAAEAALLYDDTWTIEHSLKQIAAALSALQNAYPREDTSTT